MRRMPLSGGSEEGLGGLGHEHRERAQLARVHNINTLSLSLRSERRSGQSSGSKRLSDKWPERAAESQMYYVGGRELARPPPSGAEVNKT